MKNPLLVILVTGSLLMSDIAFSTELRVGPSSKLLRSVMPGGAVELAINPDDPGGHFLSSPIPKNTDLGKLTVLDLEVFSTSGVDGFSIRFLNHLGKGQPGPRKKIPIAEGWQTISFDLSGHGWTTADKGKTERFLFAMRMSPNLSLQIRNMKLREPTEREVREREQMAEIMSQRAETGAQIEAHFNSVFPSRIEVAITSDGITVRGSAAEELILHEVYPWEQSAQLVSLAGRQQTKVAAAFEQVWERSDQAAGGRDRSSSRWRLSTAAGEPRSQAVWPKLPSEVSRNVFDDEIKVAGQKGLGGIPVYLRKDEEFFDLGLHHATMGIVLTRAFGVEQKAGWQPFSFEGAQFFYDPLHLKRMRETVARFNRNHIKVSATLLVPNTPGALSTHPDAETRGIYSMPNLTSEAGTVFYRAMLFKLMEAFSGPEHRVSNWIIHNEVDQARVWTNMGEQPLATYVETYHRSARLAYQQARLMDPFARVFISLTHHWAGESPATDYPTRELLDSFGAISRKEGDFEWGVAYHPYPQALKVPETWNDTEATFSFDTKYITPKNIEVLTTFLEQPRFLYQQKPRRILLSEQGFHTPTLSVEDQRRQVAGLLYTFHKLKQLPSIEAFHLHRYNDMPDREGGLRTGILDENRNRKLGFAVYQALENDQEKISQMEAEYSSHYGELPKIQVVRETCSDK